MAFRFRNLVFPIPWQLLDNGRVQPKDRKREGYVTQDTVGTRRQAFFSFFRSRSERTSNGPVKVGWLVEANQAGFIWEEPRLVRRADQRPNHPKSAARCPAVADHESRLFEVPCPFDMHLRFFLNHENQPGLCNVTGEESAVRPTLLQEMVILQSRSEWRHPNRPVVQVRTPYRFVADEDVYLSQLPPLMHYRDPPLPGILIGGRMPIHVWPRTLSWAFEWHDTTKDLLLTRGEPWFYLKFDGNGVNRAIKLIEAEETAALSAYCRGIDGVAGFVNKTYSLFSTAKRRRPTRLLIPRQR